MFRDYNKYDVQSDGRIWSKYSKKFLKPYTTRDGYQMVCLFDNEGRRDWQFVHRVVYCAVNGLWEIPNGMQINHKNEVKTSNEISNLELVTPKENLNYGTRNARVSKALTNHPNKSKRVAAYDKYGVLQMVFASTQEARRNGYCQQSVSACCNGKVKSHKGFEWRYLDDDN